MVYGSVTPPAGEEPDDREHAPPLELVHRQTQALNRAFRGTAFSFVVRQAQQRSFAPWRTGEGPASTDDLAAMVRELTAERPTSVHVFLLRGAENRAATPESGMLFDGQRNTDAIMMSWDYLPYVPELRAIEEHEIRRLYFQGDTLVHLVGHYFGLLHTFQEWPREDGLDTRRSKCSQTTDFVKDTPAHRWTWCDGGRCIPMDTCKDSPGMDPITNYMNLEPDLCASELTPGQVERMERKVSGFRCHLIHPPPAHCPQTH